MQAALEKLHRVPRLLQVRDSYHNNNNKGDSILSEYRILRWNTLHGHICKCDDKHINSCFKEVIVFLGLLC